MKTLIISDGKIGHQSQSIALCRYKEWKYEIITVAYKSKWKKALSYVFDWLGIYTESIFDCDKSAEVANVVIATGSTTYYPAKVIAKQLHAKSIAIMLPKGYRYDFDRILAQSHDNPPKQENIIELPINLASKISSFDEAEMAQRFRFDSSEHYIGVIIGGSNQVFSMSIEDLKPLFDYLVHLDNTEILVTTSRRTPPEVEEWLLQLPLRFLLLYSKDKFNPIPAFLKKCQSVIITSDSTSMISEAVSGGKCAVDVLLLPSAKQSKFHTLIENLEGLGALHIFDGKIGDCKIKIDLKNKIAGIVI